MYLNVKHSKLLYIFFIILLQSKIFTQNGFYVSLGFQIGIDSGKNLFSSTQVTLGYLIPESLILVDFIHTAGLTIGYKKSEK